MRAGDRLVTVCQAIECTMNVIARSSMQAQCARATGASGAGCSCVVSAQ